MKNQSYGKIAYLIRTSKHLSLSDVADKNVSVSSISQFENGHSFLSIDKFFTVLNNMNVSAEEFQELYDYYYLKDFSLNSFSVAVNEEYYSKDLRSLNHRLNSLKKHVPESRSDKNNNYFLQIIIEGYIYRLDKTKTVSQTKIKHVYDYLNRTSLWGLFEFYLMSSCSYLFNEHELEKLGNKILPALSLYRQSSLLYTVGLTMLHNMLLSCLDNKWVVLAGNLLKYTDNINLTGRALFVKAAFTYDKGWYSILIGQVESGFNLMKQIYDFYILMGEKVMTGIMYQELEKLREEYKDYLQ